MGFHGSVNIRHRPMDGMVVTRLPASINMLVSGSFHAPNNCVHWLIGFMAFVGCCRHCSKSWCFQVTGLLSHGFNVKPPGFPCGWHVMDIDLLAFQKWLENGRNWFLLTFKVFRYLFLVSKPEPFTIRYVCKRHVFLFVGVPAIHTISSWFRWTRFFALTESKPPGQMTSFHQADQLCV